MVVEEEFSFMNKELFYVALVEAVVLGWVVMVVMEVVLT